MYYQSFAHSTRTRKKPDVRHRVWMRRLCVPALAGAPGRCRAYTTHIVVTGTVDAVQWAWRA